MSQVRLARKARQVAKIQPEAVKIDGKVIKIKDISEELKEKGYIFEEKKEVVLDGEHSE